MYCISQNFTDPLDRLIRTYLLSKWFEERTQILNLPENAPTGELGANYFKCPKTVITITMFILNNFN